jgi:cytochrome P450
VSVDERPTTTGILYPTPGPLTERFAYYAELRERGEILWDDDRGAWLVLSHRLAKELARQEERSVRSAMAFQRERFLGLDWETYAWYQGGHRRINLLTGAEHQRLHRWWMAVFTPSVVDAWRENVIRPVVHAQIDRLGNTGRAELGLLADGVHLRIIAGTVGMPWTDDAWMDRWEEISEANQRLKWYMSEGSVPEQVIEEALAASAEIRELLLHWVRHHRGGTGDSLIEMMWRDFPGLLDDVDEGDILANLKPSFETNSTRAVIRNALHTVAVRPDLRDAIADGTLDVALFVEETFRMHSGFVPPRVALEDFELGGVTIRAGETVIAVAGSANVDPVRFVDPEAFEPRRDGVRDHFLFNQGKRSCPGQALGRAEIEEAVRCVIERMPGLRLDPDREPPRFTVAGNDARWDPVHVLYAS